MPKKKKLATRRPTELITFIVGAISTVYNAAQQHQVAAVVSAVLAILPGAITFATDWIDAQREKTP